jgi:nitronate monooxygenase
MMGFMTLHTAFTEFFPVRHPIALAPMGGASGGALAAAVSNGGGLGLVGAGRQDSDWLERELGIAAAGTDKPWGVGFQSWATDADTVERAVAYRPRAVMLSFGDPRPLTAPVKAAGAALIVQVTDLEEARQAVAVGADFIVAQGTEAGGHGGRRSALPFVPAVVDLAAPTPVLAAGGIADGRGVAAALALGAAGALLGTRFLVAIEALVHPSVPKAIIEGSGEDTERSRVSDIARGAPWPSKYPARTLRNRFFDQWSGREDELAADPAARQAYLDAVATGGLPQEPVWASEAIDLITEMSPAADLVGALAAQAEEALARAGRPGPQPR